VIVLVRVWGACGSENERMMNSCDYAQARDRCFVFVFVHVVVIVNRTLKFINGERREIIYYANK